MSQFDRPWLRFSRRFAHLFCTVLAVLLGANFPATAETEKKPEFTPHAKILEGYSEVVSVATDTGQKQKSLYTLWTKAKEGQMYAELPANFASQKFFIAMTVASGDKFAGLQSGDMYVYWRRYGKRLALIEPNIGTRSTGDAPSKASVKRLFTDRVVLEVPIVTIGPGGGPVVDMDQMLVSNAHVFFGSRTFGSAGRVTKPNLLSIQSAKAFPKNVEIGYEVPTNGGRLQTLHYSISLIPDSTGYKPRKADERIGYFTAAYSDLGKFNDKETRTRYITRWHLEKADSKLKTSPPKQPIEFYIEHTTPVRYRRWVKQGILQWNKAFENVGISDAIVVHIQDATTKRHMDKDPEDVRYNFVRWLNNDIGTAIGPSRIHPLTGQILDADIVLTDGWIRHYRNQFAEILPRLAMEGYNAETLEWLAKHPNWDPRVRCAPPGRREETKRRIALEAAGPLAGHPAASVDPALMGDNPYDGLIGRHTQLNGLCLAADGKRLDMSLMRMHMAVLAAEKDDDDKDPETKDGDKKDGDDKDKDGDKDKEDSEKKDTKEKDDEEESKEEELDGMPESFIGPLLSELVAHEVGHTLGLRHNFKASSVYTLDEINSEKLKGKKPLAGSVMDYIPVNMHLKDGKLEGDYTMIGVGPYDMWAIEYGYTFDKDLKPILARVAEPELTYGTDEDSGGPDPLARRYDYSKNPQEYANSQMELVKFHRKRIVDKFVKDGESWSNARRGYELTLNMQMRAVSMMSNWIGGAFVHRDKKGDPNARIPVEPVPAKRQREALEFVINNAFNDGAFGLTTDLLRRMTVDQWIDDDTHFGSFTDEPAYPVHDRIMGVQASALTGIMRPTTLRRVYDNEFLVPDDDDALTLPEVLKTVGDAIWSELDAEPKEKHSARKPAISSLRRNLQREHLQRLIDLSMAGRSNTAAYKPISNLAIEELRQLRGRIEKRVKQSGDKLDPYTTAHLNHAAEEIKKALEAEYVYYSANQSR